MWDISTLLLGARDAMWSNILWFLIFGAIFYWFMRLGGCGHGRHGAQGSHGPQCEERHDDHGSPQSSTNPTNDASH